jgi:hypothetical protein
MRDDIKSGSPERAARRELNRNTRDLYNFVLGESAHQRAYVLFSILRMHLMFHARAKFLSRSSTLGVRRLKLRSA